MMAHNWARHHDAVSVTVNHRLNILGYLDLTEIGGPGICGFRQRRVHRHGSRVEMGAR